MTYAPSTNPEELARCRPLIEAALERSANGQHFGHVLGHLRDGYATFWPGDRSVAVVEVLPAAHIWLAAGDMGELFEMERALVAWASARDVSRITFDGRPGWGRAMRRAGYEPQPPTFQKRL